MKTTLLLITVLIFSINISFADSSRCQMKMYDNLNDYGYAPVLDVTKVSQDNYIVTDRFGTDDAWSVTVDTSTNPVQIDAGVPDVSKEMLINEYSKILDNDEQVKFKLLKDSSCSKLEKGMIYFLVLEWFYFG